jgi:tetratricopeptide (TPR) repeat protein
MRIWQARFVGLATMLVAALFLCVSPGTAQKTGGGTAPAPVRGAPNPTTTPTPTPPNQTQTTTNTPQPIRPIWIKGLVMMSDGEAPTESVTIERVCSANSVHAEGYADSKGYFSFNLGQDSAVFADASNANSPAFGQPGTSPTSSSVVGGGNSNPNSAYWDCELRARLPGYRSSTISLAGRRMMDDSDVGVIVLYPMTGIQGLTASATSSQAPKDARKALEKGLAAVQKDKLDQAEQEFRKAVQIYPKFAEAWLELGEVLERRERYPEAREAYASSLAADSKYVYPYQQLYQIALREQNWKDLANKTDQLLHLDPYEFPNAYYFNALAHLELQDYDAAEKSAQQAVEADWKQANPKTHYMLGAILVKKKDWIGAAESFRAYLKAAPDATDKEYVEKTLSQIDQQIKVVQTASQNSTAQP